MEKLPVFHLVYPNRYLLCSSLLRFAAYYEDPKYRGEIPSLEEYMDSYAKDRRWEFTYFNDWEGFNFPGYVLDAFADSHATLPLLEKELAVIGALREYRAKHHERMYVIGTFRGDGGWAMGHEMAHAYFYLYPEYAKEVAAVCRKFRRPIKRLSDCLIAMGYHKKVIIDECNAYILTGLPSTLKGREKFKQSPTYKTLRKTLLEVFKRHFGHSVASLKKPKWIRDQITTIKMKAPKVR